MLLKGGLAKKGRQLSELKAWEHNLKRLWREFKTAFANVDLTQHDKTISQLDKFEEMRYPSAALKAMAISVQWSGEPPRAVFREGKTPKQFVLIVSDVDALVADVIMVSSWNQVAIMPRNPVVREAIARENAQAGFFH